MGKLARTAEERAGKDSVETAEELRDTRKKLQSVEVMKGGAGGPLKWDTVNPVFHVDIKGGFPL